MKIRFSRKLAFLLLLIVGLSSSTCSPGYIARASWEETKILWRREQIAELIQKPETNAELKRKLQLVLDARAFAESLEMSAKGSFTKYSAIDRDVLLWVLSGAPKLSFTPVTWWFPIVGRVPYKGFFEKTDAELEASELREKNLDIYLRPSPAFSTLGWFDDPLLSTTIKFDDIALVNTVIHEILHNTVWIQDHVPFNETLANFVGSMGAVEFFTKRDGQDSPLAREAKTRWQNEIEFARFLENLVEKLKPLYDEASKALAQQTNEEMKKSTEAEYIEKRNGILKTSIADWHAAHGIVEDEKTKKRSESLNNATIAAYQFYLTKPWLFEELFQTTNRNLKDFIALLRILAAEMKDSKQDPYQVVSAHLALKTPSQSNVSGGELNSAELGGACRINTENSDCQSEK